MKKRRLLLLCARHIAVFYLPSYSMIVIFLTLFWVKQYTRRNFEPPRSLINELLTFRVICSSAGHNSFYGPIGQPAFRKTENARNAGRIVRGRFNRPVCLGRDSFARFSTRALRSPSAGGRGGTSQFPRLPCSFRLLGCRIHRLPFRLRA